ncbi:MAG: hypothetical protein K5793_02125 [Nitrosarchaeum sp.]|nr:hypothetical protein [Nitrosarchaeum sp.]
MKKYLIPLIVTAAVIAIYFSISQTVLQENGFSKQCDIPYDVNFIERRDIVSGINDGKPHYSIAQEFSIFSTIPIEEFSVDEDSWSLILKPVPNSHGYVIMCNPLPILEKRFDAKIDGLMVLVDNEEIEHHIVGDTLKINVNNNTRIEIIGFFYP